MAEPDVATRVNWFLQMPKKEYPRAWYLTEELNQRLYALGKNAATETQLVEILTDCGKLASHDDDSKPRACTEKEATELVKEFVVGFKQEEECLIKIFIMQWTRMELFQTVRYLWYTHGDSIPAEEVTKHVCAAAGKYQGGKICDHLETNSVHRKPIDIKTICEFYFTFEKMLKDNMEKLSSIDWDTELLAAVKDQHVSQVKIILSSPSAKPNICFPTSNQSILHAAVEWDNKFLVQAILAGKADVNAKDPEGRTPLHLSLEDPDLSVVHSLLAAKADCTQISPDGTPVLHMAMNSGDESLITTLLEHGADVSQSDTDGKPALAYATELELDNAVIEKLTNGVETAMKSTVTDVPAEEEGKEGEEKAADTTAAP